jgi:hypothetical protein
MKPFYHGKKSDKPYYGIKKRIAKKKLGNRWHLINEGMKLKAGDLINSCKHYNETIKEIIPVWIGSGKANYVRDFDIETVCGSFCSFRYCCGSSHVPTHDEIYDYWKSGVEYILNEKPENQIAEWIYIAETIKNGGDPFDESGRLKKESQNEP